MKRILFAITVIALAVLMQVNYAHSQLFNWGGGDEARKKIEVQTHPKAQAGDMNRNIEVQHGRANEIQPKGVAQDALIKATKKLPLPMLRAKMKSISVAEEFEARWVSDDQYFLERLGPILNLNPDSLLASSHEIEMDLYGGSAGVSKVRVIFLDHIYQIVDISSFDAETRYVFNAMLTSNHNYASKLRDSLILALNNGVLCKQEADIYTYDLNGQLVEVKVLSHSTLLNFMWSDLSIVINHSSSIHNGIDLSALASAPICSE